MANRIYNYSAFYVAEPFNSSALGAYATHDFVYYNTLKAWKGRDSLFPFCDAHQTTYNVRDSSSWEYTLKPRLHERLRNSKNIVLFLSSNTRASRALNEEMEYGIGVLGLPVIVVYPEFENNYQIANGNKPNWRIEALWNRLPSFRDRMKNVPTAHVPFSKEYISKALADRDFTIQHKSTNYCWCYS